MAKGNFFIDLAPYLAVLSNPSDGIESIVQLSAGGDGILSAPASPDLNGRLIKLTVVGRATVASGGSPTCYVQFYQGTTTGGFNLLNGAISFTGANVTKHFTAQFKLTWSSTGNLLYLPAALIAGTFSGSGAALNSSVSSQSNLQFIVTGQFSNPVGDRSLTITQFSLELEG